MNRQDKGFERMTFYCNLSTGELTENHREAVEWYRNGEEVSVLQKRDGVLTERTRWTF